MQSPHKVTKDFEAALCEYSGAKYAVAVNSCTAALFLSMMWCNVKGASVIIPKRTYCSVPMQIIHAGGKVVFEDREWTGSYRLYPFDIWDCARRFTSKMYREGSYQCLSFHWSKILGIQQGGAILHNNPAADDWFRRARFDGRTEGVPPAEDKFDIGWHCYTAPRVAAEGLVRLSLLPDHNEDLPNSDYPDLSRQQCFEKYQLSDHVDDQQLKFLKHTKAMSLIDDIESIRTKNNGNWMDLLRLAFTHAPDEAAKIMSSIYTQDQEISSLAKDLSDV